MTQGQSQNEIFWDEQVDRGKLGKNKEHKFWKPLRLIKDKQFMLAIMENKFYIDRNQQVSLNNNSSC